MSDEIIKSKLFLVIILACFALQACSLYQKPEVPATNAPQKFKYSNYKNPIRSEWWKDFGDTNLNKIVTASFKNNYTYQQAVKNIEIARTYVTQNTSMLWPQFNLNANASRNHSMNIFNNPNDINGTNGSNSGLPGLGRIYNLGQLFATVAYEVDVWNQIGNAINQANADLAASCTNSQVVKLTLLNSVVDTYFQIATFNANIANLKQQKQTAQHIIKLISAQYHGGLIDYANIDDAKNQLEMINSNLNNVIKNRQIAYTTLAYLLGEYPENFKMHIEQDLKVHNFTKLIPASLPSQMMTERPDIQQAYYQVLSNGYIEKQTYANFFPSFNLTGSFGYSSQTLANFVSGNNSFWNYGLNIVAPIFDYQLRSSQYARAKLQYENAMLNYKNVVVNAFKEVDAALVSYQQDSVILSTYKNQYSNNANKLALAKSRYESGLTDYSTYLTMKLALLQNEYNVNNQNLIVIKDVLQVYKSLGLGLQC